MTTQPRAAGLGLGCGARAAQTYDPEQTTPRGHVSRRTVTRSSCARPLPAISLTVILAPTVNFGRTWLEPSRHRDSSEPLNTATFGAHLLECQAAGE